MKKQVWFALVALGVGATAWAQQAFRERTRNPVLKHFEDAEPTSSEAALGLPEAPRLLSLPMRAATALPQATVLRAPRPPVSLKQFPFFKYELIFTNPVCARVPYPGAGVFARDGQTVLTEKPQNVYCRSSDEVDASRRSAPKAKLLSWINDRTTREIFFTYLSFSDMDVAMAVCRAIRTRDVKVTLFIDKGVPGDDGSPANPNVIAGNFIKNCQPRDPSRAPTFELRGHEGGIDFSHNKIFIVNPGRINPDTDEVTGQPIAGFRPSQVRIAFSSGNLTTGLTTHHENWNFITTSDTSHFAQAHVCLMSAMIGHASDARDFSSFMNSCVSSIDQREETDVRSFFTPASGDRAAIELVRGIQSSNQIWMAAHRFSFRNMLDALEERIRRRGPRPDIRLVADDDLHWTLEPNQGVLPTDPVPVTRIPNMPMEAQALDRLLRVSAAMQGGMEARYMETNQLQFQLHHNKFLIFDNRAVFTGAGNLTGAAFRSNLENYYVVTIPEIIQQYRTQHERMWNSMASIKDRDPQRPVSNPQLPAVNSRL